MLKETRYWLEQADHHAEEAANYFAHYRPRSGADELAKCVAILECSLPLVVLAQNPSLAQEAQSWIFRVSVLLANSDYIAINDELKYERGFILHMRNLLAGPCELITELDTVLQECLTDEPSSE